MNRVRKRVSGKGFSVNFQPQSSHERVEHAHIPILKLSALISLMLFLNACAGTSDRIDSQPADVEERVLVDGQALPFPEESRIRTESLEGTPSLSGAVKDLLDDSMAFKRVDNYEAAAESLERALRIEPRNPVVWHELADLRLVRQEYQQAIQFAQKSNALIQGDDETLQRRNWNLIALAYRSLGNSVKASEYQAKLRL